MRNLTSVINSLLLLFTFTCLCETSECGEREERRPLNMIQPRRLERRAAMVACTRMDIVASVMAPGRNMAI